MSAAVVARRWIVEGRVQGVGFRWFVRTQAEALGVGGWVRNLPDGAVEVVGRAAPETLDRFDLVVRRGPRLAGVREVRSTDMPPGDVPGGSFDIRD